MHTVAQCTAYMQGNMQGKQVPGDLESNRFGSTDSHYPREVNELYFSQWRFLSGVENCTPGYIFSFRPQEFVDL